MPKLPMCNFGLKNGLRFGLRLFFQLHSAPGQLALVKTFFFTDCGPQIVFHGKWGILTWYWIHKTKTKSYHYEHNLPQTVNIQGVFILAIICAVLRAQPLSYCWRGLGPSPCIGGKNLIDKANFHCSYVITLHCWLCAYLWDFCPRISGL